MKVIRPVPYTIEEISIWEKKGAVKGIEWKYTIPLLKERKNHIKRNVITDSVRRF